MSHYAILRIAKLKNEGAIVAVQNHNDRSSPPKNADPNKTNRDLFGEGNALEAIKSVWQQYDIKPRKNAVKAIEYVLTGSPNVMNNMTKEELNSWAVASVNFLKEKHGAGLVRAWLHLDESSAHIHAIVTPIIEKTVRKKLQVRLCARSFFGGKEKLSDLQTNYASHMKLFGLKRGVQGSTASHKTIKRYYRGLLLDVRKAQRAAENYQAKDDASVSLFNFKSVTQKLKKKLKVLVKKLALVASESARYRDLNQDLHQQLATLNRKYRGSDSARAEQELEQMQRSLDLTRERAQKATQACEQQRQQNITQHSMIDAMRNKIKTLQNHQELSR